jgi:hypothetical protein
MASKNRMRKARPASTRPGKGASSASRAAREAKLAPGVVIKKVGSKEYDLSKYRKVKTAGGNVSLDCGDAVAKKLEGKPLEDVYKETAKALDVSVKALRDRYQHLNTGMQRMNLGNRLRGAARAEA